MLLGYIDEHRPIFAPSSRTFERPLGTRGRLLFAPQETPKPHRVLQEAVTELQRRQQEEAEQAGRAEVLTSERDKALLVSV
jgi:hypothetical protein